MSCSTTAPGIIIQIARGLSSFFTSSASEDAPTAPSLANSSTAWGDLIVDHALMVFLEQPPHHVRAHPSKTDHSDLHRFLLFPN